MNLKNKKVLVTGGTGLIGRPLVNKLIKKGAIVEVVSLDEPSNLNKDIKFHKKDLRELSNCINVCKNQDVVFHLAGVKGSPKMTSEKPASFLVPTVTFSFNMMEAARRNNVENFLFTSSIGVYEPADKFIEKNVWKTFPSKNDWFAGWAKRICELQADAYRIQYNWDKISIVRPANVFGPYDNFNPENAMVIPSLIHRILSGENPLRVWGDGSTIRDFIFSEDVADGMIMAVEKNIQEPINLGSGKGISIREIVEILQKTHKNNLEIIWDKSKPSGDRIRVMDTKIAKKYGFKANTSAKSGITKTYSWYKNLLEQKSSFKKYNSFEEKI